MHIKRTQTHNVWDRSIAPVVRIAPGDVLVVELENASGGQLRADSNASVLATLDFARINPVTGPIFVEGARPGDALVVEILELDVEGWGWTANIPGFGLLADRFAEPALRISRIADGRVELFTGMQLPSVPMIGTIGVAPILVTDARAHRTGRALATTGIGPDLLGAARDATNAMIAEIVRRTTLSEIDAYLLASVAADLKISEVVDVPNWVVSLHIDASLLA